MPNSRPISSISLDKAKFSLMVRSTVKNSASVVDIVTVLCLPAFYTIGPPNKEMIYPWEEYRVLGSSAKEVSFAMTNASVNTPLYLIARKRIIYK